VAKDKVSDEALERPENWDFAKAERHPPAKGGRAIVSVAFSRDDLRRVAECAAKLGMRTSEFIRQAALEKASRQQSSEITSLSGTVGGGWVVVNGRLVPFVQGTTRGASMTAVPGTTRGRWIAASIVEETITS
jgi:hypothetical protein